MTRTKGWIYISGVGGKIVSLFSEIDTAIDNVPYIRFNYPSDEAIRQIEHDIQLAENTSEKDLKDMEVLLDKFGTIEQIEKMLAEKKARRSKQ